MTSFRDFIARNIGLNIKSLIKGESARQILTELNQTQWFSREEMHELRTQRLRNMMIQVGTNVPFYREVIKNIGADPVIDNPWEILEKIPTMDRQMYRSLGKDIQSDNPARKKPYITYTSGTTGEYLKLYIDYLGTSYRYLAGLRGRQWWGVNPGASQFKIWGGSSRSAWQQGHYLQAIIKCCKEYLLNTTQLPPFFASDEHVRRAVRLMCKRKPEFVLSYANTLHLFASFMLRNGIQAGPGWPKVVSYSSEMLADWQIQDIQEAFNSGVASEYGSVEAGVMAYSCPKGAMHTSDDIMVLEIMDGAKKIPNGNVGEIVVTSLFSSEFPIIRYRQGDLASLEDKACSCGLGLGVMCSLNGRKNDYFLSPSGGVIDFVVFALSIKDQPAIRRFKVVERQAGDLVFLCELHQGMTWGEDGQNRLLSQCLGMLPADVKLSVGYVGLLPPEASGKFRIMIPEKESKKYLADFVNKA